jgi:nucleoside diphosphate kinase
MEAHNRPMNALMERESSSVRAALGATDPRVALRDTIRMILAEGFPRATLVTVLDELADELRAQRQDKALSAVVEVLDVLEEQSSPYAVQSFLAQ